MADDAAKAEKLAAARKKYEELKKRKPGKKGGASSSSSGSAPTLETKIDISSIGETVLPEKSQNEAVKAADATADFANEVSVMEERKDEPNEWPELIAPLDQYTEQQPLITSPTSITNSPDPSTWQLPSASRPRVLSTSGHFRRPSLAAGDSQTVPDVYRKQTQTIQELTEDKVKLTEELDKLKEKAKRLDKLMVEKDRLDEELATTIEQLRQAQDRASTAEAQVAEKKDENEDLKSELSTIGRQNSHLISQLSQKDKDMEEVRSLNSSASPSTFEESLNAKEERIENMSMELSSLRSLLGKANKSLGESASKVISLETQTKASEETIRSLTATVTELDRKHRNAMERLLSESATTTSHQTRINHLEQSVKSSSAKVESLEATVKTWEAKHLSLTTLYKETEARGTESHKKATTLQRENIDILNRVSQLKEQLATLNTENKALKEQSEKERRSAGFSQQDHEDVDDLEDAERSKLRSRIHFLEGQLQEKDGYVSSSSNVNTLSPSKIIENVFSGAFSDVDLDNVQPTTFAGGVAGMGQLFMRNGRGVNSQTQKVEDTFETLEREARFEGVKKNIMEWKGFRLDVTGVTGGGGVASEIYHEIFEV